MREKRLVTVQEEKARSVTGRDKLLRGVTNWTGSVTRRYGNSGGGIARNIFRGRVADRPVPTSQDVQVFAGRRVGLGRFQVYEPSQITDVPGGKPRRQGRMK